MTTPRDIPDDPGERWAKTPRPFTFVRPRLHEDEAAWLRDRLADIKDDAFEEIERLRTAGRTEEDDDLAEAVRDANYAIGLLRIIERAYIDFLGPRAPQFK